MALTQAPRGCAVNGSEERGERAGEARIQVPGRARRGQAGRGPRAWLLGRAQPSRLPPRHSHNPAPWPLAAPSSGAGERAKRIFSGTPRVTLSLDQEGSGACPFQGQVTGEPGTNPILTERRRLQARGESGRSDSGFQGWGRANRVLLSWKARTRAGTRGQQQGGDRVYAIQQFCTEHRLSDQTPDQAAGPRKGRGMWPSHQGSGGGTAHGADL